MSSTTHMARCYPSWVELRGTAPHDDDLAKSVDHFNGVFRFRYGLPPTSMEQIAAADGFDEAWTRLPLVRADGVLDPSCATVARAVLSLVPQYAIGFLDGFGAVTVQAPDRGEPSSYRSQTVLLFN